MKAINVKGTYKKKKQDRRILELVIRSLRDNKRWKGHQKVLQLEIWFLSSYHFRLSIKSSPREDYKITWLVSFKRRARVHPLKRLSNTNKLRRFACPWKGLFRFFLVGRGEGVPLVMTPWLFWVRKLIMSITTFFIQMCQPSLSPSSSLFSKPINILAKHTKHFPLTDSFNYDFIISLFFFMTIQ